MNRNKLYTFFGGFALKRTIVALAILGIFVGGYAWSKKSQANRLLLDLASASKTQVKRGNMVISMLQSGELESKRNEVISNEADRESKIVFIVDDGAKVKKGDLLLELDSEEVRNNYERQKAEFASAEADLSAATEQLAISEMKYKNDLESAKLKLELGQLDLKKFEQAEFPQLVGKATMDIQLAKKELIQAEIKRDWTKKLVDKGYSNKQELETDEMEVERKKIAVTNKETDLTLLTQYTHDGDLKKKQNLIADAEAEIKGLTQTYDSQKASDIAKLASKKVAVEVSRVRLKKVERQLEKTKVFAEHDGQVFYPKMNPWDNRKIAKGEMVHERQTVLMFPDLTAWNIKTGVPESIIDRIKSGQAAFATVDALPDTVLKCTVTKVGVVPDNTGRFFDPSGKSYTVTLDVDSSTTVQLKPGMSTMVEIVTGELKNVLQVPIQAIATREEKRYAYVVGGASVRTVEVKVGEHNDESIQILDGLKEGQQLLLYAPVETETKTGMKERPLEKNGKNGKTGESRKPAEGKNENETKPSEARKQVTDKEKPTASEDSANKDQASKNQADEGQATKDAVAKPAGTQTPRVAEVNQK